MATKTPKTPKPPRTSEGLQAPSGALPAFSEAADRAAAACAALRDAQAARKLAEAEAACASECESHAQTMNAAAAALAKSMEANQSIVAKLKAAAEASAERAKGQMAALQAQGLAALAEASLALSSAGDASFQSAVRFLEVELAGTRRHAPEGARKTWSNGTSFELIPEPSNPADPHAVMVMSAGAKIGYLTRESAQEIQELAAESGWTVAGPAFMIDRSSGKYHEGRLMARLESPVVGWRGFNPLKPLAENLAAMEACILRASSGQGVARSARHRAL